MKIQRGAFAGLMVAMLLLSVAPLSARNLTLKPISEESYSRLNEEARAEYDRAYKLADRILYEQALDATERAVELQPTSVELRFFAIRLAAYLAEVHLQAKAVEYLERAAIQCEAILEMEGLPPSLRDRIREDLAEFTDRAENIYRRDELRKTWGSEVAKDYVRAAYRDDFEEEREERLEATLEALRNPDARRSLAAQAAAAALADSPDEDENEDEEEPSGP